jgi:serine/threonine-protein kinase
VTTDARARLQEGLADRYRLERELGRGGMATVYLARDVKHDRPVALKVMHPDLGLGAGAERFLREIHTTARLDHPHILPVHDSGEAQGLLWYTMPYVDGESLRQRLERAGPLPVSEALQIAGEVADALACAHHRGVVHRDIKPENILLAGGHARVADFGIASALEAAAGGGERLTGTGVSVGTPAYMSPEQAGGARVLDGRSDVYSLGCVLYELLTGEAAFTGPTPQAVIARRFVESPPPISRLRQAVSPAVEAAVERALAREPADRFQTAAEFRGALTQAAVVGSGASAPAPASQPHVPAGAKPPRPGRVRWRSPAGAALLALGVLLLIGMLFVWRRFGDEAGEGLGGPKLIVVLPFETLGDSADAYLADGVSDAVRGKLAALPGLRVIAGASSREYRGTTKRLSQVAQELGVRYLVVGRVRREGGAGPQGRLRVSPELVEVGRRGAPTTLWEEPMEASLADLLRVQGDVARAVAEVLGVALAPEERLRLARPPTENLAAYQAFLRGEQITNGMENDQAAVLRQALPYYEQAVALDSEFVEAWARLSEAHSWIHIMGTSPGDAAAGREAAQRAIALAPGRPEGYLALGTAYIGSTGDNQKALEQFTLGLRVAPHNAELLSYAGLTEQFLGRWGAALEHFREASALDPRSPAAARTLAWAHFLLRRYPEALAAADRALALDPNSNLFELKAMIHLGRGDLPGARAVVRAALKQVDPATLVAHFGQSMDLYWVLEGPEQELLLRLPPAAYDNNRAAWGLVLAQTYHLRGDSARTRSYADSARLAFEAQLRAAPEDPQLHALHGLALGYLGRGAGAVRECERAVALVPISKDGFLGPYLQHQLVRTYLLLGETEKALDHLEPLLKIRYVLSPGWLKIDPNFAPLRGNPRFERLVNGS